MADCPSVTFLDASPVFGGAQRSMLTTIQALHAHGVDCLAIVGSGAFGAHLRDSGIPLSRLPFGIWRRSVSGLLRAAGDLITFRSFLKRLTFEQDTVFYANGIQSGLLFTLSLPKSAPLIFHHRDLRCPKMALRKVLSRANRTIVLSDMMMTRLRSQLPTAALERAVRVYNGFDWESLETASQENVPDDMATDGKLVTFVADVVPWKRHDRFIEAMALATKRDPRLRGLIIGGTRDRSGDYLLRRLKRLVNARGVSETVRFAGYVDNPMPLIRASAATCALADDEPFGRMAVEAGACGTPLVTVRGGGPAEIAAGLQSACIVAPTAEAIADGILTAADMVRAEPNDEWRQRFSVATNATAILKHIEAVGTQA